jgi:hypothetical protein
MKELRFLVDCADRVMHGDLILPQDLPEALSDAVRFQLSRAKHLLVEGIEQGPHGTVILHVSDSAGPMSAVAVPVRYQPGEYVTQSRKSGEPNYRAPNGTFWAY